MRHPSFVVLLVLAAVVPGIVLAGGTPADGPATAGAAGAGPEVSVVGAQADASDTVDAPGVIGGSDASDTVDASGAPAPGNASLVTVERRLAGPATDVVQQRPETDVIVTRIRLFPNGTAVWEVEFVTRLTTETQVDDFRAFQETFRNETATFLDAYRDRIVPVVDRAANETGRPMTARRFDASTSIQTLEPRSGTVTYRFQWTAFARTDGDRLVVGDVFDGGFFVGGNDTLVVVAPEAFRITAADPAPGVQSDRRVAYDGLRSFADGRPRVVVSPVSTPTATEAPAITTARATTAPDSTDTAGTGETGDAGGVGLAAFAAVLLVAVVVAVGFAYRARHVGAGSGPAAPSGDGPPDDGTSPPADADGVSDGKEGENEPTGGGSAADTGDASDGSVADPAVPEPYADVLAEIRPPLTDEDRVRKALAENGGRMRQSDVADRLDWSASKTSRVLSDMADDGTVEKLRVGRQNVIDLVADDEE